MGTLHVGAKADHPEKHNARTLWTDSRFGAPETVPEADSGRTPGSPCGLSNGR